MSFHVSLSGRRNLSGEIYRQMRRAILDGRLRPGDRLPPSRELARTLNVSRMTVTVAYDRLAGERFVTSRVRAGMFVSARTNGSGNGTGGHVESALKPRPIWDSVSLAKVFDTHPRFDFRSGIPDGAAFPHRTWRRLMAGALRAEASTAGVYAHPAGQPALREAIARHIGVSRGVAVSADDVTITNGTQQALDIMARVLLSRSDTVAVEDPGYPVPKRLFQTLGFRVVGIPVDRDGIVVDALPRKVGLVYVTPSHQYPLGVSMSLARRHALLAWAAKNNAAIIEDDYDSEFRFSDRPLEPLQTLDTAGRVAYVGTFSKTMLPTLRLGFLVAPRSLRAAVHKAKFVADWHTPTVAQAALARFIDDGGFARHIRRMCGVYRERHDTMIGILKRDFRHDLEVIPSTTGLHVTAIARRAQADELVSIAGRAAEAGVAVHLLSMFAVGLPVRQGFTLGYGAIPTNLIEEGLRRFRKCFGAVSH